MAGENLTGQSGTSLLIAQAQVETEASGENGAATQDEHGTTEPDHTTIVVDEHGNVVDDHGAVDTHTGTEAAADHGSDVFPPFDSSTFGPQLFWLAITFGTLYLLMSKIALPRIGEILEVRRDRIEGDLAEAERLRQKTDQAIESYEAELGEARAKSHAIADETRNKIKADMDDKRREVEADLAKQVASAETRILKTKTDALANVDQIAADTAVTLVSKLSGKVSIKDARSAVASVVKG